MLCKRGNYMNAANTSPLTYNNYTYSILGENTSVQSFAPRIKDYKIPSYKVREKRIGRFFSNKYIMSDYLKSTNSYFPIPGLSVTNILGDICNTMVPQGICTFENYVLITAYDSQKIYNSVIYVLENHKIITTLIYDKKVHMGGICYDGSQIWIAEGGGSAHGDEISYITKDNLFSTINTAVELKAKSITLQGINPLRAEKLTYTSFCSFYDNLLWIGSFNEKDTGQIYGYAIINTNNTLSLKPVCYIEAPAKAQGICFYEKEFTKYICVSTSYGRRHNSVFKLYSLPDYYNPMGIYNNVKHIHKGLIYKTLTLPSMSEQINIYNNSIYCIFESGASKYVKTSSRPIGSYCIFDANKIFQ